MKHSRLHIDVAFAHIFVDIQYPLLALSPVSSALEPMQPHDRSAIEAKADAIVGTEAKALPKSTSSRHPDVHAFRHVASASSPCVATAGVPALGNGLRTMLLPLKRIVKVIFSFRVMKRREDDTTELMTMMMTNDELRMWSASRLKSINQRHGG
jgi:hypothetical protein